MKLRKILSSTVAASIAMSAMVISASAATVTSNSALDAACDGVADAVIVLKNEDGSINLYEDNGVAIEDVYGLQVVLDITADVVNGSDWVGGGMGANSESTGWKSVEWGQASGAKPIVLGEDGVLTWLSDAPVFAASDTYNQLWIQAWGIDVTVKEMNVLGADGSVLFGDALASDAAATSFAGTKYLVNNEAGKGTLFITAEEGSREPNLSADAGVDQTSIYGVTFFVDFDENEIADEAAWIGGGIGANSNSTGWLQKEWGRADKEFTADLENGTITMLSDAPIFAADDTYCQLWLQTWGGTVTVNDVALLDAEGNAISVTLPEVEEEAPVEEETEEEAPAEEETEEEAPAEEETEEEAPVEEEVEEETPVEEETEEEEAPAAGDVAGETDSSKGSPDTGVEDVAVVAGLAIVAAGAVLVSKKRK